MDVSEAIAWFYNNQGSISHNGSSPLRMKPILLNVQGSGNHEAETNTSYSQPLGENQSVPGQFWQEILERLDYSLHRSSDIVTMDSHESISQQTLLLNDHGSVNVSKKARRHVDDETANTSPRNSSIHHITRRSNHQEHKMVPFQDHLNRHPKKNSDKKVQRKKCQKVANKITALQKIVSPYGKTDTTSVLQEASIFIKVLHKQIQILTGQENSQRKQVDLQTNGVCLVPVSFIQEFIEEESESAALDRFMQLNNLSIQAFRNS